MIIYVYIQMGIYKYKKLMDLECFFKILSRPKDHRPRLVALPVDHGGWDSAIPCPAIAIRDESMKRNEVTKDTTRFQRPENVCLVSW